MSEPQEKKALNWWIKATQLIRETLKPHIDEYNSKHPVKLSGTIHVSVAKALKMSNKLSATITPQEADIVKAYKVILDSVEPEQALDTDSVTDDKITRLSTLLTQFFDGETTEIIIRRRRAPYCCTW